CLRPRRPEPPRACAVGLGRRTPPARARRPPLSSNPLPVRRSAAAVTRREREGEMRMACRRRGAAVQGRMGPLVAHARLLLLLLGRREEDGESAGQGRSRTGDQRWGQWRCRRRGSGRVGAGF
ncbi:unnamed protein product, partial [Urochloa humidicola]